MSRAFSSPYLSLDVQDQVWLNTPMQCHMQVCMGSQGPARCCACSALVGLNGNNAVSAVRYKWLYTWQKRGIAAPCLCKRTAHCSSPLPPPTASSPGPCWVSLGESWDFPSQPVKVETMNNSVTKHLCKEEQASTCREVLCMQLHVHSCPAARREQQGFTAITHILENKQKDCPATRRGVNVLHNSPSYCLVFCMFFHTKSPLWDLKSFS